MSGRNPMGARLPPSATERPPARLPDGSESQYHGGSFGAYMAHKERKLQVARVGGEGGAWLWRAAECRRTKGTAPTAQVGLPLRFRHPTPAG